MSFSLNTTPRRRSYVRLIGEIQRALNSALEEENAKRGLTRTMIADILGKNKSVITRKFAGSGNMTLETLADLAYALNRPVKVSLPSRDTAPMSNHPVQPRMQPSVLQTNASSAAPLIGPGNDTTPRVIVSAM